jgi:hypothetical protein
MLPTNLWVPETISNLNDLLIFVYEAAAPVEPVDVSCIGLSMLGESA